MKQFIAIFGLLSIGASAQDKMPIYVFSSPVMGRPVKGAPYSADEITESLQVLADGTRISNQSKTTVYRDSEGRVRRESPTQITIFDPVAGFSYTLDPADMTAVRSNMGTLLMGSQKRFFFAARTAPRDAGAVQTKLDADATVAKLQAEMTAAHQEVVLPAIGQTSTMRAVPRDPAVVKAKLDADATLAKLQAEMAASQHLASPANDQTTTVLKAQLDEAAAKLGAAGGVTENLGQQTIEGLTADGTRTTETIEAGAIGNDRPIRVVDERWFSADLQTAVMTRHSDPRSGEETFRLTNVQRSEQPAYLFALPPDYRVLSGGNELKKEE